MGLVVAGHGDGHVEAVGIAGLRQQSLGLLHITGVVVGQAVVKILAEGGIHAGTDGAAIAVKGQVDDLLLVHGIAQGLPDADIVKGGHGVVQVHGLDQVHSALGHVEVLLQLGHLGAGQMGAQVDGAALEAHHQAVRVLHDLQGDLVQLGGGAPVAVELLQHHGILGGTGDKLEGAGAHGVGVLLVVIRGQDSGGHVGNELIAGFGNGDGNGLVIRRLNGLNNRKRLHLDNPCLSGGGAALDGVYHILRRHRFTVMELHAFPQVEGVGHPVLGYLVAFGDGRGQISVWSGLHQPLEHIEHDFSGSCLHGFVRVKTVVKILCDTND